MHDHDEGGAVLRLLNAATVRSRSQGSTAAQLDIGRRLRCSIGRSGRIARKREGDGGTPIGTWRLVEVLYRADRVRRPVSALRTRPLRRADGWCDAIGDRNYNRAVRHPYPASAERLWRDDHVYDIIVVTSHNRRPRVQGNGSAVFVHLAREGYAATEGCVALSARDLRLMLASAGRQTRLVIR